MNKNNELNQELTREQIVSAIKSRKTAVAWLTAEGALIYDPITDKIRVRPDAVLSDVQQIAATLPCTKLIVVNSHSGVAYAAAKENEKLYSCDDPGCPDPLACADTNCVVLDKVWERARNPELGAARRQKMTVEKIKSAIRSASMVVAWVTDKGAIIFDPDSKTEKLVFIPGGDNDVVKATVPLEKRLLIVKGVWGMALAAHQFKQEIGTFRCDDPACPHLMCEDINCHAHLWQVTLEGLEMATTSPSGLN